MEIEKHEIASRHVSNCACFVVLLILALLVVHHDAKMVEVQPYFAIIFGYLFRSAESLTRRKAKGDKATANEGGS